jgi:hypothetical protein
MIYIGCVLLSLPERDVWMKTPYQISLLFKYHREYNPDRWKPDPPEGESGDILDGLI